MSTIEPHLREPYDSCCLGGCNQRLVELVAKANEMDPTRHNDAALLFSRRAVGVNHMVGAGERGQPRQLAYESAAPSGSQFDEIDDTELAFALDEADEMEALSRFNSLQGAGRGAGRGRGKGRARDDSTSGGGRNGGMGGRAGGREGGGGDTCFKSAAKFQPGSPCDLLALQQDSLPSSKTP